ncbi:hypothetical protein [Paraburkholderia haematera]|uniref:Uncharacterized protein n=1 Tax=Paraburkholderia haematera TaxID=2793077 RepID=A0ABM8SJT6_9BURK|nr:hypothetical protein [Paraburkholderia haematera]CAE6814932.1 hypothetical protein R69888_05831 [Paraburkholderia haematera]
MRAKPVDATAKAISQPTRVAFADFGGAPQVRDPLALQVALLDGLAAVPANH